MAPARQRVIKHTQDAYSDEMMPGMLAGVRVVLADDAALWRDGISRLLTDLGADVIAAVGDADSLKQTVMRQKPDIAVVDVRMPPTLTDDGLRAALWIRRHVPGVAVLLLSQHVHTSPIVELLGFGDGGVGYLLKERVADTAELLRAVQQVARGGSAIDPAVAERLLARATDENDPLAELTARELEVLVLIGRGSSNVEISESLVVSPRTLEAHIRAVFTKLGIRDDPHGNHRVRAVLAYLSATGDILPTHSEG